MSTPLTLDQIQNFKGKHPKQIYLLFFTEMWERFTFYGNRALLIMYMVTQLKFDDAKSNMIYGVHQSLMYALPVLGGFLADRYLGQRKSILWGGILLATGSFVMAIPIQASFFIGMSIMIVGNGYFKPNISTIVGNLYKEDDARRDAGFSLFYMGINLGAALGGLICGYVGKEINWHIGFGIAGIFMLLGLTVFYKKQHTLGPIGLAPETPILTKSNLQRRNGAIYLLSLAAVPIFVLILSNHEWYSYMINPFGIVALIYVLWIGFKSGLENFSKIIAALVLTLFSSLFWAFYEQGGGSLNLFADRNVNMHMLGFQLSSTAINNFINSFFVVVLTPFFIWLWIWLAKQKREPNAAVKFGLGIIQLGLGFFSFVWGASLSNDGLVSFFYFALGYLFMTTGEMCLSPIGLSAITKLSPKKMVGIMMGMWFLASSYGQYLAGLIGTLMAIPGEDATGKAMSTQASLAVYTGVFSKIAWVSLASGILLLILSPWLKKMMRNVN
ncbi:MAG: hypothetical protein RLY16_3069 [Bacteroidota bacterium]